MYNFLCSGWVLLCVGAEELRNLNEIPKNIKQKRNPVKQGNGDKCTQCSAVGFIPCGAALS